MDRNWTGSPIEDEDNTSTLPESNGSAKHWQKNIVADLFARQQERLLLGLRAQELLTPVMQSRSCSLNNRQTRTLQVSCTALTCPSYTSWSRFDNSVGLETVPQSIYHTAVNHQVPLLERLADSGFRLI